MWNCWSGFCPFIRKHSGGGDCAAGADGLPGLSLSSTAAAADLLLIILVWIPVWMKKKADTQGRQVREQLGDANAVTMEGVQGDEGRFFL